MNYNYTPTSLAGQGRIVPAYIPATTVPITDNVEVESTRRQVNHGTNMFVTLRDGKTFVGRVEVISPYTFTVGNSDPLEFDMLKSAVST